MSLRCPPHQPHLLGDGRVVVLQDEPLDVVSPHTLLLHALGLRGTGRAVGSGRGFRSVPKGDPHPMLPYLQAVLLLAMLVVCQAEAQRVPRALNQHQRGALPGEASKSLELPTPAPTGVPAFPSSPNSSTHWSSWHPPCPSIPGIHRNPWHPGGSPRPITLTVSCPYPSPGCGSCRHSGHHGAW